jgi:hypothetical protein
MARPAFVVTQAMCERVRYLAGLGVSQDDIAKIIGCSAKTLRKRFRDELDRGAAEANASVAGYLFNSAKAGSVAAQIFWLKTRGRWREATAPNPISDANPEPNSPTVLILPDNGRDPQLTQVLRDAQEKYFAETPRRQPSEPRP